MFKQDLEFQDVFVMSVTKYGQSCVFDSRESLVTELEDFDFLEDETEYIFETLNQNNLDTWIYFENEKDTGVWLKKSLMTKNMINNLPEFNGW